MYFVVVNFFVLYVSRSFVRLVRGCLSLGAPSVSVRLHPNREVVRRGDNLEVRCDVTGDSSALVSWRRVGGQLSRNAQVLGNLLRYVTE